MPCNAMRSDATFGTLVQHELIGIFSDRAADETWGIQLVLVTTYCQ